MSLCTRNHRFIGSLAQGTRTPWILYCTARHQARHKINADSRAVGAKYKSMQPRSLPLSMCCLPRHQGSVPIVNVQLILGITCLSKLGTGQANSPEFGTGRTIVIHGHCQSGKSHEICVCSWLADFIYETLPYVFVMNHGGLGILPQMRGAFKAFHKNADTIVQVILWCRSQVPFASDGEQVQSRTN
jgi:hypothetical protein